MRTQVRRNRPGPGASAGAKGYHRCMYEPPPGPVDDPTGGRDLTRRLAVVLRAMFVRLNRGQAERALAHGAPAPVDTHPEGESRPQRGGRAGGRGRRPR